MKLRLLIVLMISLCICGCNYESDSESKSSSEIVEEYCQTVYDAFCHKDIQSLQNLFCEEIQQTHDLEQEIKLAFDFIDGEIVSYEEFRVGNESYRVNNEGKSEWYLSPKITNIKTSNGKTYEIIIAHYETCLDTPEYRGFSELTIYQISSNENGISETTAQYDIGEYIEI